MENEFPANSHNQKETRRDKRSDEPSEKKAIVQVTRSKATLRKKPLRKRFAEAFTGDGNQGVLEYVFMDVLIPGVKDVIVDTSTMAIERALLGESSGRRRGGRGGGGYTSYNRMSDARPRNKRDRDRDDDRRDRRPRSRASDHSEIILDTRVEAEEVVDNMFEILSKYEVVTMRDLLGMVGESHNQVDEDWGWTDLRGARVHKVRGGYLLDLPRPESLD